jgi:hypothetical protein
LADLDAELEQHTNCHWWPKSINPS